MSAPTANIKNMAFDSDTPYERVALRGSLTFTTTNTPQTVTHGFGYVPLVKTWYETDAGHAVTATQDRNSDMSVIIAPTGSDVTFTVLPNQPPFTMKKTVVHYRIYARGGA